MQGIHRKERENRKSKQKEKNTLDSYRPSHGRTWSIVSEDEDLSLAKIIAVTMLQQRS